MDNSADRSIVSVDRGGQDEDAALRTKTAHRPRVEKRIEDAILDMAFRHPAHGQDRIARELHAQGLHVSASGVRYVLQRHDLETISKRVHRIEAVQGRNEDLWTAEQFSARDRVQSERQSRSMAASFIGRDTASVSRSTYILAIAARLLRERSFDATSLRDIAKAAHIPLGSLYYHFQTKEELFAAVYEEGIRRITRAVQEAIATCNTPWERLEMACVTHLQHLCGGDDFTATSIPTNLPRIHGPVRLRLRQLNDGYEGIFRDLIADLNLPSSTSPTLVRLQLLGAMNWTRVWFKAEKTAVADIARQYVHALRYGLDMQGQRPPFPDTTQAR